MQINPVLMFVWASLATCLLALLVYRGQLTRYEDERLFLSEEESAQQQQHLAVTRRVTKLEPLVRMLGGAASVVTASVVGIYVWDAWTRIQ